MTRTIALAVACCLGFLAMMSVGGVVYPNGHNAIHRYADGDDSIAGD